MNSIWVLLCATMLLIACNSNIDETQSHLPFNRTELDKLNVYVIAGDYYEMKIGVKGDELTGVYLDPKSNDNNSCLFFFEGKIGVRNPVKVKCYNPTNADPVFNGDFKILGDVMIRIFIVFKVSDKLEYYEMYINQNTQP